MTNRIRTRTPDSIVLYPPRLPPLSDPCFSASSFTFLQDTYPTNSTMPAHANDNELYESIRSIDLIELRNNHDKLYHVAEDFQQKLLEIYGDRSLSVHDKSMQPATNEKIETLNNGLDEPPLFWSGLEWVPAEWDYPTDITTVEPSCFGSSHMEVLVYNCSTNVLEVRSGLQGLQGKKALFTKLQSRRCSKLNVCVEKVTRTESKNAPRYRITNKAIPHTMTTRCTIPLNQLNIGARLQVLLGHIKWIFVLNISREFSNLSGKLTECTTL
ncbi:hypothetical protein F4806DRAFT_455364, partial [Annulohypoxylon nitens]